MRWKLLRRRLSISAPRMIVRSHLPWPLRWAVLALMLGFSAALALWAFEVGKDLAGLDRDAKEELAALRIEVAQLRSERERALSVANTADSLLKVEKAVQDRLAQQVKLTEADNLALKADLGLFEQLLPNAGGEGLTIRGLQAEVQAPGRLRYQMLLMQSGKGRPEFVGRYGLTLGGTLDGEPWTMPAGDAGKPLQVRQYLRVEGEVDHPAGAVIKSIQVTVTDRNGATRATQTMKL